MRMLEPWRKVISENCAKLSRGPLANDSTDLPPEVQLGFHVPGKCVLEEFFPYLSDATCPGSQPWMTTVSISFFSRKAVVPWCALRG
jgi:hypothetical protein